MRAQHLIVVAAVVAIADAYVANSRSSFIGRRAVSSSPTKIQSRWTMDIEHDFDLNARVSLEEILRVNQRSSDVRLAEAEAVHGMPWKSSIDPKVKDDELLYMPFWEWQMSFMKENLTDLRVLPCTNEYRKIRLTYYDAGENTQVFNSVWYPDPKYNLPVLGIDLLAFNRKKYLAIVDFQPLHESENDHASPYEHILEPIKEKYDSLKGRMSSKFYDETQFFSQQMLFARFEDEDVVNRDLFPAFQSYVETHLNLLRETVPEPTEVDFVMERQKAYDTYSAERDPATGLFTAMYGNDWAQDFVHDFLFSMSERPENPTPPAMPFMGGPPQGQQQQRQAAPEQARERVGARLR